MKTNQIKNKCHICKRKLEVQYHGISSVTHCPKDHVNINYHLKDLSDPYSEMEATSLFFKYRLGRRFYEFAFYPTPEQNFMSIRRHGCLIVSMSITEYMSKYYKMSDEELRTAVEILETFS